MSKPKIYLFEYIHPSAYQLLKDNAEIISDAARLPECDGALNRNYRMDKAWLDNCPALKVIGVHGTGTDGIDLAEARSRGIRVVYAPGENAQSVAELIVSHALTLSRHVQQFDRAIQSGTAVVNGGGSLAGHELKGRVFGTIGCGSIGAKAAFIMKNGFGMETIGYSRSLTEEKAAQLGLRRCSSIEEVFSQADIINISVPMSGSTRGMVDRHLLSMVKPGAILINTARGGIVDEQALYEALTTGCLAAAACDVFSQEPPSRENPLVSLPNFLATPHIAANTDEALFRVSTATVQQMLDVLNGKTDGVRFVV